MKTKIYLLLIAALFAVSCTKENDSHASHNHGSHGHAHEEATFQITGYSEKHEVFAEADAFVVGHKASILAHFSKLPDFRAVESGTIQVKIIIDGVEIVRTLDEPTRKGIYKFFVMPKKEGKGRVEFIINDSTGTDKIVVPNIEVFADDHDAIHALEGNEPSMTNAVVFTKEQSWKTEFATDYPAKSKFGEVIKTVGKVEPTQGNEEVITAKTNGFITIQSTLLSGQKVGSNQVLFSITDDNLANDNFAVKFATAKSNFESAEAEFNRVEKLNKDKIVSNKEYLQIKNEYETAKAEYDNLKGSFNKSGQDVRSPMSGFIKQVFVKNGEYVEAGQSILSVSQSRTMMITAEVHSKFSSKINNIQSFNIKTVNNEKTYSSKNLDGKILSVGKSVTEDNYLIPIHLQVNSSADLVTGSYVEMYLKTSTDAELLNVPKSALIEAEGNYFVFVQINPELFEKREVKIGGTDGVNTVVTKGLEENERIVTQGAIMVKLSESIGTVDAHSGHVH
jgi:RND family efflux transporter MFP subunit